MTMRGQSLPNAEESYMGDFEKDAYGGPMDLMRAEDWVCGVPDCGHYNFAKHTLCVRCISARDNAAPGGETDKGSFPPAPGGETDKGSFPPMGAPAQHSDDPEGDSISGEVKAKKMTKTQARNARRCDQYRLKRLQTLGLLSADADFAALRRWEDANKYSGGPSVLGWRDRAAEYGLPEFEAVFCGLYQNTVGEAGMLPRYSFNPERKAKEDVALPVIGALPLRPLKRQRDEEPGDGPDKR
ncbi:hypothetical protein LTR36_003487 [Oleoguttula mirabilis]|uniref:RanBP2-type domain-containing protein n=1 Tax=Oleoguttula mirabilis TaxID=1507867 RepID=A0AAV9JLD3_9PEZI|nr:hypothetical protein LTR36_003487 [Oleoguttula mirabilis]